MAEFTSYQTALETLFRLVGAEPFSTRDAARLIFRDPAAREVFQHFSPCALFVKWEAAAFPSHISFRDETGMWFPDYSILGTFLHRSDLFLIGKTCYAAVRVRKHGGWWQFRSRNHRSALVTAEVQGPKSTQREIDHG